MLSVCAFVFYHMLRERVNMAGTIEDRDSHNYSDDAMASLLLHATQVGKEANRRRAHARRLQQIINRLKHKATPTVRTKRRQQRHITTSTRRPQPSSGRSHTQPHLRFKSGRRRPQGTFATPQHQQEDVHSHAGEAFQSIPKTQP